MSHRSLASAKKSTVPVMQPARGHALQRQGIIEQDRGDAFEEVKDSDRQEAAMHDKKSLPPPPPPPDGSSRDPQRAPRHNDFALLKPRQFTKAIHDEDGARIRMTRRLLEELAPLLGLDPNKIEICVNQDAESRLNSRGAGGLMEGGTIYLHPKRYQPQRESGRYLLAHELTHAAQRRGGASGALRRAESEANRSARAFVRREPVRRPAAALSDGVAAAFIGDEAQAATALVESDHNAPVSPADQREELDALVAATRRSELARMIDLLSYGFFDWAVTDENVTDVLRVLMTVNMLTARSLVSALPFKYRHRLLDNLDTVHYRNYREQVLTVYWGSARAELMPFSGELRKAFETMDLRLLSRLEAAAAQYALESMDEARRRQLRSGKRRDEIETILTFVPDSRDEALEMEEALADERQLRSERAAAQAAYESGPRAAALRQLVKLITETIDRKEFSAHDALRVLAMLMPYVQRKAELRAIADHLADVKVISPDNPKDRPEYEERYDYLDRLIRFVPIRALYASGGFERVFFLLLSFRPAYKNAALAEEKTDDSRFILVDLLMKVLADPFVDRVTSEDAYLAFLLVKAMPAHARQAFFSVDQGARWTLVMNKLSQKQRESAALNLYSGGKADADRNALLAQLLSDAVWTPDRTNRLDGLIRMAIAAGEHEFVFNQSEQRQAYAKSWLKPYVDKYRLFDPQARGPDGEPRTHYSREVLKGTPWYTGGWLVGGIYTAAQGLDFVFSSDNVEVATTSVGGKGLNLVELQDLFGGNFMGARFADRYSYQRGKKREPDKGVNFANVKWDTRMGVLTMTAPDLQIEAIRYPIEDFTFQTGAGAVSNLEVKLAYSTGKRPEPTRIDLIMGKLILLDVALIAADKMKSLNRLDVGDLQAHAGSPGSAGTSPLRPREGLKVPIPLVGIPLGGAWNLFLGSLWNALFGLLKKGSFGALDIQPKAGISASATEMADNLLAAQMPMGFSVRIGSVNIVGLTTSGGQFIESISLDDLVLQGGGNARAYRIALKESLSRVEQRLAALRGAFGRVGADQRETLSKRMRALEQQRRHTQDELTQLAANEREVARLEALQRNAPQSLSAQERLRLRRLKAQLSGAVLDVGRVSLKGLAGLSSGEFALEDVHGAGRSVSAALSLISDSDKLKSFITGAEGRPILRAGSANGDTFTLDIGHVELPSLTLKGALPTAEAAAKDYAKFLDKHDPWRASHVEELERLARRKTLAAQREALIVDPGISQMTVAQQTQFRQIERALDELETKAQLTVGRVVMDGATLNITDAGVAVGADELLVEDMRKGSLQIRRIAGSHVQVGVEVREGFAGLDEWRKKLQRVGIKGESVIVTGIKNEEIGLEVDRATLMGIDEASLDVGARNASARITTKMVLVEGVRLRNFEDLLIKERDYLNAKTERKPNEQKRLETVQAKLDALAKLRQQVAAAEAELSKARTPKQKSAAQNRRDEAQRQLDHWAEGLVAGSLAVSDLDVDVVGLGDVLSEAYDPASALDNGIEVRGRGGPGGRRIFSGAAGVNVGIPGLSGSKISVGETAGRIAHSKAGTLLDGIHIDTIAAQGIDWRDGQRHAFSRGETRLQGIDITAFIGEEQIVISKLELGAILADQLGYEDESAGLSVIVESGGLGGIHITNLTITLPKGKDESAKITGKVVADSLNDLKLNALVKGIRAKGTLSGSNLSADFVTDRQRVFSIGDLSLKGGEIIQPGSANNIHVSFRRLRGAVTQEDLESGETQYTLRGVSLSDLTVGKSRWADGGKSIEVNGQASLRGVTLDAEVLQAKKEPDGSSGKLKQLKIVRLRVEQIDATDIHLHRDAVPPDPKKPADQGSTSKDITLEKGTIIGLEVTGIDLMKDIGKMTGQVRVKDSIDLQKLRIAIGDAGKDQVVTTLSVKAFGAEAKDEGLRGRELRATLFGEKGAKIEIGTIKEVSGDFEGFGAKTGFSTGQITMSPIEISGDGGQAKVSDVEIKDITLTSPKYTDGSGTDVKLDSANVTAVHIKGVVAKFGEVTDRDGKKSQGMTDLEIAGLKFDFIGAKGFEYTGKITISSSQTKSRTIKADKAELTNLEFESLSRNFNTRVTKFDAKLSKTSVTGFAATFGETISGKTSQTEIFGNIEAGSMHAMLTLTGTKALGEDWTSIDGLFELTDPARGLGLTNARIVHTDAEGKKLELGVLDPKKTGGFDLTGLKVKFAPNGTLYAEFDELAGKNLKLKAGGATVEIPLAKLKKAALGLAGMAPGQAFDVLGAKLNELEVQGIKVTYEVDRSAPSVPGKPGAASAPWVLDALQGLDGTLNVRARGTAVGDVAIPAKIRSGSINFDDLTGDDGYFLPGDIWFFVSKRSIWARHFKIPETLYESKEDIPGVSPAIIEYTEPVGMDDTGTEIIHTRGQLNLKEFLEGTLNKKSSGSGAPAEPLDKLNTLELTGTLDVGDGVIGTTQNNVTLFGKGSGKNRISISGARLGSNIDIAMPEFQASKAKFELFGKAGETGQINANMALSVTGLGSGPDARGHLKFTVTLTVVNGVVRDIKFGNVTLASEAALRARPAPPQEK